MSSLRKALLDFFHYQKCGVNLDCGVWSHAACHTSPATVYGTNRKKDVAGGWHDAGDYGRYTVAAATTAAALLLAYEHSPEPDNDVPETVWFELEWLLKMQDEQTGGVFHKVTCRNFCAFDLMPEDEHEELILSPVSAAATAGFAAVTAMAARFYPGRRDQLLTASRRAWDWLIANPNAPGFKNPPDITTGEYGDDSDADERFWAACELFAATGEDIFHNFIKSGEVYTGLGWRFTGTFGLVAYLLHTDEETDPATYTRMREKLLNECDEILQLAKNDPYGISLGGEFRWGSNMVVANNAMTLLFGGIVDESRSAAHTESARKHMDYLLGNNPFSRSYITGFGPNPPKNPHHRPSIAKGQAVPGMVVGGPDMQLRDSVLQTLCKDEPPVRCYVDDKDSYASNEIAIYWNSPVYFVLSVLGE